MLNYNPNTPILFLVFIEQPEVTLQALFQIKKVSPQKLYIAVITPEATTENIVAQIDWQCSLEIFPANEDKEKMTEATGKAVSLFFEKEEEGIILSDYCLPSDSFFGFCSSLLEKYRNDERISQICGANFQNGAIFGDGSYYFSSLTQTRAWASWRRAWKDVEKSIQSLPALEQSDFLGKSPVYKPFKQIWLQYFKVAHHFAPDLWNLNFAYHNMVNNRLSIVPNVNMIEATNYDFFAYPFKREMPQEKSSIISEIIHPATIVPDIEADTKTQLYEFCLPNLPDISDDGILLLKQRLLDFKNIPVKIPHIIHQIYVCEDPADEVPQDLIELSKTWQELHSDWEYRFWDKVAIDDFLQTVCPDFAPYYYGFPYNVQRWDSIRYLILYYIGGVYVDMDYECIEPIDALLGNSSCCMGLEPQENAFSNRKTMIIGNALMASVPHHGYFEAIIEEIKREKTDLPEHKALQIMETTGPFMITRMYENFPDKEAITLLPAELIAPLCIDEVQELLRGQDTPEMEQKIEKAFAVHYFGGSWVKQTEDVL